MPQCVSHGLADDIDGKKHGCAPHCTPVKVIARKAQPLVTAMDGSIDMACVEAIHRSGRTGRCVAVDLSPLQD